MTIGRSLNRQRDRQFLRGGHARQRKAEHVDIEDLALADRDGTKLTARDLLAVAADDIRRALGDALQAHEVSVEGVVAG